MNDILRKSCDSQKICMVIDLLDLNLQFNWHYPSYRLVEIEHFGKFQKINDWYTYYKKTVLKLHNLYPAIWMSTKYCF